MKEYLRIFKALPFPSLLLSQEDDRFVVKDVSRKYCELSGRKREDVVGKPYPQIFSSNSGIDEDFQERVKSLEKVLHTGRPHKIDCLRFDLPCPEKRGSKKHYWQVENIPIKDSEGDISHVLNIAKDKTREITEEREKKEIHEELAERREKQQHFIEMNPDGLYSLDSEGNFLGLNEGLARLAETPEEEMLQMNFIPFCAPHHRELILDYFKKALEGEKQDFEADFVTGKGKRLILKVSLMPMKMNGQTGGVYGIAKDITSLRTAEEELRTREKKFKALVQEGSDLMSILNLDGTYKFVSETSKSMLGIPPEDFIGENAFDFLHPEDKERVMKDFSALEIEKQVRIQPFRHRDIENGWRWLETTATDLRDEPSVNGIVVNSKEVTELVERSAEIKDLYERYRLAATATEDLIYDWDLKTDEVIRFFKGMQRPFGHSRQQIENRDFWRNQIHPEEAEDLRKKLDESLGNPNQTQIRTGYRFRRADGTYAHLIDRAHIVRNEQGKPLRVIGATSDISDVVENKFALNLANKRFSYAMRATNEMIWDWDLTKDEIKRSGSFKKMFGYNAPKKPSVENFWFRKIVEKDRNRVKASLKKAIANPEVKKWKEEYCFIRNDGEEADVVDRGYILREPSGKAIRMVGAVLDVTESRRMIKEIKKQNKILKEVAWEQAHIVRAPLARLKALLNLLEEESYEEWDREELIILIGRSADELDEIIENIIRKTETIG